MKAKNKQAFTLVELLVVIGIIALLISILLPALSRAKEQSMRVKCMSNHKQLVTAVHYYAQDWKDRLPHTNWASGDGTKQGWLYDGRPAAYDPKSGGPPANLAQFHQTDLQYNSARTGALFKYLRNEAIYRCPFDNPPYLSGYGQQLSVHEISSYGMNGAMNGFGRLQHYKLGDFKADDIIFWELDETYNTKHGGTDIFNDVANFPHEGITLRHGSKNSGPSAGGIVSTIGGTVQWITAKEFYEKEALTTMANPRPVGNVFSPPRRTRLYCVPKG